jgi:hypothetical protein
VAAQARRLVALMRDSGVRAGTHFYLLYWHKSTNTDARRLVALLRDSGVRAGAHFTCFTGTKVQILTPEERQMW